MGSNMASSKAQGAVMEVILLVFKPGGGNGK